LKFWSNKYFNWSWLPPWAPSISNLYTIDQFPHILLGDVTGNFPGFSLNLQTICANCVELEDQILDFLSNYKIYSRTVVPKQNGNFFDNFQKISPTNSAENLHHNGSNNSSRNNSNPALLLASSTAVNVPHKPAFRRMINQSQKVFVDNGTSNKTDAKKRNSEKKNSQEGFLGKFREKLGKKKANKEELSPDEEVPVIGSRIMPN
jgi:hypothetical protein